MFSRIGSVCRLALCLAVVSVPIYSLDALRDSKSSRPKSGRVARDFRRHCVQVRIKAKTSNGDAPSVGQYADDIANERPTLIGGYWWDRTHVIIEDQVLSDRFINSIEVSLPGEERSFPARVAGRFLKLRAMLLEVLPNAEGELPDARPLRFVKGDLDDAEMAAYEWSGVWEVITGGGLGSRRLTDDDLQTLGVEQSGVILSEDGKPIGVAFDSYLIPSGPDSLWRGSDVRESPFVGTREYGSAQDALREKLVHGLLEVRFKLRVNIEDENEDMSWMSLGEGEINSSTTEAMAAGMVVSPKALLVPIALDSDAIARIDEITVVTPSGGELVGKFAGAYKNYMAVLVEVDGDLEFSKVPEGFGLLAPNSEQTAGESAEIRHGMFLRWRVDYHLGRRRESPDYDRWEGYFRGYAGDPIVATLTNEDNGSLAFTTDGELLAVSLMPRIPKDAAHDSYSQNAHDSAGFRPLEHLAKNMTGPDSLDRALFPTEPEDGKRLFDLGVEWQSLDQNTAKLFHVERETRGGKIGLLTTYVYPGSLADTIGLRENDILMRLFVEGRSEPIELHASDNGMPHLSLLDIEDMSPESVQRLMSTMSPPWPSRDNDLTAIMASIGGGREARLEYLREGEKHDAVFTTKQSPPDFKRAPKYKSEELGLTVKAVTYEVERFFRLSNAAGVIVGKVEDGSLAGVAGLHPYLLITHVDGNKVADLADFKTKIRDFERDSDPMIELTVEGFGKTRLVKIER